MSWHRLEETIDGDSECAKCHVVIAPEAHSTFTLPCPQPDCTASSNPDRGCVFIRGRGELTHCLYCGKPGGKQPTEDEQFDAMAAAAVEF